MILIEFLRQFRFYEYAIFDFIIAFLGIYLLSSSLSKIFLKIRINIPKQNWLFLTLPISIFIHLIIGEITPMTRDFININDYYILKILILGLFIIGVKGIRIINKNDFKKSNLQIEKLFENSEVVAVNKPVGLVVHFDGRTEEPNLCDWVLENYPEVENVGEPLVLQDGTKIKRPGIVHRLDRETSGALIVAKTQDAFLNLKEQFQNKEIKKIYKTFVWGKLKDDEGIINRQIGKSSKDFRQWSAQRGAKGKLREAITEYKVLNFNEEFSYLEINLKTGRTHQIRVHMKAINNPVVGDKLYAPKRDFALDFTRVALHAYLIEFFLLNGEKIKVEADLPEDFEEALKIIKK
ncbi:MAG: RluA family pseudouridine synthase [Candidatus Pacebacteria bacterium]|nr:RluA family pseudouridine synthase [Candidatus Paceibacterota bacterium]